MEPLREFFLVTHPAPWASDDYYYMYIEPEIDQAVYWAKKMHCVLYGYRLKKGKRQYELFYQKSFAEDPQEHDTPKLYAVLQDDNATIDFFTAKARAKQIAKTRKDPTVATYAYDNLEKGYKVKKAEMTRPPIIEW